VLQPVYKCLSPNDIVCLKAGEELIIVVPAITTKTEDNVALDLILMERYVMNRVNLEFVWNLDPPVVLHALSYPPLVLIVDSGHIECSTDRPVDSCRAADIRL
jgi:hypothetical protein